MYQKLAVIVLFGLICTSSGNRVKYARGIPDGLYRGESTIAGGEPVYKREQPVYQRETVVQPLIKGGVLFNGNSITIKPDIYSQEQLFPSGQVQSIASEPVITSQQFVRPDVQSPLRSDAVVRTEPVMSRQPITRYPSVYQSGPVTRENSLYTNEPNSYATVMVAPYSGSACLECPSCAECSSPASSPSSNQPSPPVSDENYYQIQPQPIVIHSGPVSQPSFVSQQPVVAQHFLSPKITYQKPAFVKPTFIQSYVPLPKIQRYFRKTYRPIVDRVQITTVPLPSPETTAFQVQSTEPFQFPNSANSYRNQAPVPADPTPEPQTTPATTRSPSSRFSIPAVSSIC